MDCRLYDTFPDNAFFVTGRNNNCNTMDFILLNNNKKIINRIDILNTILNCDRGYDKCQIRKYI